MREGRRRRRRKRNKFWLGIISPPSRLHRDKLWFTCTVQRRRAVDRRMKEMERGEMKREERGKYIMFKSDFPTLPVHKRDKGWFTFRNKRS
jgi:hypothetical protein